MMQWRPPVSLLCCFAMALAAILLLPEGAWAQSSGSSGSFHCVDGRAAGSLYSTSASCPTTITFDHLFSFLVCNLEELSSNLMGNMFCGMILDMTPVVSAVLTLAVTFFSLGFIIGVIPFTARELQIFLIKIAFIWGFATQSDLLLEYGYKFLVDGMRSGVDIVLTPFTNSPTTVTVYERMDKILGTIIKFGTDYLGVTSSNPADICKDAVLAVLAVMAIAFPPLAAFGIALILRITMTFLRAIFGYIYAFMGIAFLLTLAPFFLSFFLFKQTRSFFDKWLGYLVSYALQIVLLFSFLAFVFSIDVTNISGSFSSIVVKKEQAKEGGSFRAPWEYCTLCDFEAYDPTTHTVIDLTDASAGGKGSLLTSGRLRCKTNPPTAIELDTTISPDKKKIKTLVTFTTVGMLTLLVLAYILEGLMAYTSSIAQQLSGGLGGMYAPQLGGSGGVPGRASVAMPFEKNYNDFESGLLRGMASKTNTASGLAEGFKRGMGRMVVGEKEKDGSVRSGFSTHFSEWLADPTRSGHSN